jgi:8-oxo-dGTP pyrophosphatase MutT (NUDIX family)
MDGTIAKVSDDVNGLEAAISRFGEPVRRCYHYQVTESSWRDWETRRSKRAGEVVLLLRRKGGHYLVHTKGFYPQGVYRLLSGGIKPGEDLVAAVLREAHEETGLRVDVQRFLASAEHCFAWQDRCQRFASYLFLLSEQGGVLGSKDPAEAISDFREVPLASLEEMARNLESLSPEWSDWGCFRASMHHLAVEVLRDDHDER